MKLKINNQLTNYQLIGKGQPTVLLHGWGGDWQSWAFLIPELSKKYQLLIPDLPGMGQSSAPAQDDWGSENYCQWLEELIRQTLDPRKKIIIIGHSLGGKIASLYAAHNHDKVKKLVLIAAAGLPDPLTTRQRLQQSVLGIVPAPFKNMLPAQLKTSLLKLTKSSTDHAQASHAQRQILKNIVQENISQELVKITSPTTLIWGQNDQATPLHQAYKFNQLIKDSDLRILEDSGHFPFIDEPKHFMNFLIEAL